MHHYSRRWYDTFLHRVPAERTDPEVAFLKRHLPLGSFPSLLDVCCGAGRHATPLAESGYRVTGVDIDKAVLAAARRTNPDNPRFLLGDMRDLSILGDEVFDAAIIMWQSWGHFAAEENERVLRDVAARVRPGGRLVLDVYDRAFFERHQGVREREQAGQHIVETKVMDGGRLKVELAYDGVVEDRLEWEILTPRELHELASTLGLRRLLICTGFDDRVAPVGDRPRFQAIFERK